MRVKENHVHFGFGMSVNYLLFFLDDDNSKFRLPSGADVDDPGISVELNALNASSSVKRNRVTFLTVDKGHSHEETETTENENNELSQKDQEKHDKDDFTVFNQHLKSRSLKTKKKASTETGSSAQSNLLRKDERKKGSSNSEGIYCKKMNNPNILLV